jgi:hypothetical protein
LKYLDNNRVVRATITLIFKKNASFIRCSTCPISQELITGAEGAITKTPSETSLSLERKPSRIGVMETCLVIEEQTGTKTDPTKKATGALPAPEHCNWVLLRAEDRESRSKR